MCFISEPRIYENAYLFSMKIDNKVTSNVHMSPFQNHFKFKKEMSFQQSSAYKFLW